MFNSRTCLLFALIGSGFVARAEPILPTAQGTTWDYEVSTTEEPKAHSTLTVRINGTGKIKGKDVLKFDTLVDNDLLKAEMLAVDEQNVLCYERTMGNGKTSPFDPPQSLLPSSLKIGTKWELDEVIGGNETHTQFAVAAEEDVTVPAGTFHAFRFRSEQPWPLSMTIERWFVPGTGFVKDVTTTRGPTGRLLNRVTMAMTKLSQASSAAPANLPPSIEVTPQSSPSPAPAQLKVEVAKARDGEAVTEFRSDAPNIYVRWSGQNLPVNSGVRIVWIAEDVGDVAAPNFVVDETETLVTTPEFSARFTLSRPRDGWARANIGSNFISRKR